MINTYHTSYNPPPVPPRAGYSRVHPPGNTPLVKFLSVMLLLLMMLTFGGFLYLFQKLNVPPSTPSSASEHAAMKAQESSIKGPAAHLVLQTEQEDGSLTNRKLKWNKDHSLLKDVLLSSTRDTLTIKSPGIYFIYSQITFSKLYKSSLKQAVWSKALKNQEQDKEILRSFCSLDSPGLCTASLSGVFDLKINQQLYVTVTNTTLLNRDSCYFGLFKLQ